METKTATFTFFTLLFLYTVSAARPTANPPLSNPTAAGSKILLPGEKVTSDENNLHPVPEKTMKNDLTTPRTNISRFHPINRHFQVRPHRGPRPTQTTPTHRRPCMKHMIPQTEASVRKDEVAAKRTDNSRSKTFRGEVPENWLKVKHHYGSRRQHNNHNYNQNNRRDKNDENVMKTKNVLDREKMKSLNRRQKPKNSDDKSVLMKNIRKFLKHTFD